MTRGLIIRVAALLCVLSATGRAQVLGTNIEIFGNAGAVGGVAPVVMNGNDRALLYAGALGNVGLQFQHVAAGIGLRYCEFRPTSDLGGEILDFFLMSEIRAGRDSRTALRLAIGLGQDTFDTGSSGNALSSPNTTTWAIGIGHEIPTRGVARLLVTADLIIPQSELATTHRKSVGFEIGVAYRGRQYQPIRTLPGGRR